jgi:diaminopimelate epimerase
METKTKQEEFLDIYNTHIKREGADSLLNYLQTKSDFFTAPCSAHYHASYDGGLCEHSVNVYRCLADYLERDRVKNTYNFSYSDESVALVALLHDLCKIDMYKKSFRNVKNEQGKWEQVPTYKIEDGLPYGHGEKSVYIISGFMRLSREEAFAIRYHMGFSGANCFEDKKNVGQALEMFPLAFALSVADMEATYFVEGS